MGYRIVYGDDPVAQAPQRKSSLRVMTAGFALAFVVLVRCFWPQGAELLRQILVPGEQEAWQQMTREIQAGEPVADAVTAFCRSIVEDALGQTD